VYLKSAEGTILAFLRFCEINNLGAIMKPDGFESRPAHQNKSFGISKLKDLNRCSVHNVTANAGVLAWF
jgi:hypothetical protein